MGDRAQLLNDNEEAQRLILDGRQSNMWTALPGIVKSVDLSKMTCEVQPAIQGSTTAEDGVVTVVNLPLLVDVPIVFPRAGSFILTLPLAAGDEVLVCFSSRCIDAWWQLGGVQRPMEARMNDLSDGFAIPGPSSQAKLVTGISSTGAQLRNLAGTTYVEISADGKIKMKSPVAIEIDGDVNVTGDVVADGISLKSHTHPYTWTGSPGSGSTGGPT